MTYTTKQIITFSLPRESDVAFVFMYDHPDWCVVNESGVELTLMKSESATLDGVKLADFRKGE